MTTHCPLSFFGLAAVAACLLPAMARAQAGPPADDSPHAIRSVAVEPEVRLEVLDWGGRGKPLVFLAGLGNTAHVFDDFAPRFRDRFHVYAITRRGFGSSTHPAAGYDSETRARDVLAVLDTLGIRRAVLAGQQDRETEVQQFQRDVPRARIVALPGANHFVFYSNPDQVERAMREFLKALP